MEVKFQVVSSRNCGVYNNDYSNTSRFYNQTYLSFYQSSKLEQLKCPRITKKEAGNQKIESFNITDDRRYNIKPIGPTRKSITNIGLRFNDNNNVIPIINIGNPSGYIPYGFPGTYDRYLPKFNNNGSLYNNCKYYYISRVKFAVLQIEKHYKIIQSNMYALKNHISKSYYGKIYGDIIQNIIVAIINIFQNISFVYKEEFIIANACTEIYNLFKNKFDENESKNYSYSLEHAMNEITNVANEYKNIMNSYDKMYKILIKLYNIINTILKCMNLVSANEYTSKYFNDMDNNNIQLSNLYLNAFYLSNKMPADIKTYMEQYYDLKLDQGNNNHLLVKQKIIRDFIPVVTNKNWNFYYGNVVNNLFSYAMCNIPNIIETRMINMGVNPPGYIAFPNVDYNCCTATIKSRIGYLIRTVYDKNNDQLIPEPKYGLSSDKTNKLYLYDANINAFRMQGNIGTFASIAPNLTKNKGHSIVNSVGLYIDDFYSILKTYIIQKIIKSFAINPINQLPETIKDILINKLQQYGITDSTNKNALLYATIGKTVDEILINNFRYYIENSTTKMINNVVNNLQNTNIMPLTKYIQSIDYGFKVNFNKLQDNIINLYTKSNNKTNDNYNNLRFADKQVEDEKEENQITIHNLNYITGDKILNQCYKMDPSIVNMLYNRGINMNTMDVTNSTPLYYALYTNYPELIKVLLNNGSFVHNNKINNKNNLTPFEFNIKLQKGHVGYFENFNNPKSALNKFYLPTYTKIINGLHTKQEFANNIILYLDNIFPQMLLMYNHQLYLYMTNYINYWNYQDFNNMCGMFYELSILQPGKCLDKTIPQMENINIINSGDSLQTIDTKQKELSKKYGSLHRDIMDINNKINNINNEITNQQNGTIKTELANKMLQLMNDRLKLMNDNPNYVNDMNNISDIINNPNPNPVKDDSNNITINKNIFANFGYIKFDASSQLYDDLYQKVFLDQNYKKYNIIWSNYIKHTDPRHIYNIHLLCVYTQSLLLNQLNNPNNTNYGTLLRFYQLLENLYRKIFNFTIDNSINLCQEYNNKNIFLKNQIDIIAHCCKHIIFSNFYNIVMRTIVEYIKSVNPSSIVDENKQELSLGIYKTVGLESYNKLLSTILTNFVFIKKFIVDELPIKTIKIILNVWDDGDDYDDPDKKYDMDKLFDNIITLLITNSSISITKESSLIKNLVDYIFPYFREIISKIIPEMKKILDNYNKYILMEYNNIQTMTLMINAKIKQSI